MSDKSIVAVYEPMEQTEEAVRNLDQGTLYPIKQVSIAQNMETRKEVQGFITAGHLALVCFSADGLGVADERFVNLHLGLSGLDGCVIVMRFAILWTPKWKRMDPELAFAHSPSSLLIWPVGSSELP